MLRAKGIPNSWAMDPVLVLPGERLPALGKARPEQGHFRRLLPDHIRAMDPVIHVSVLRYRRTCLPCGLRALLAWPGFVERAGPFVVFCESAAR